MVPGRDTVLETKEETKLFEFPQLSLITGDKIPGIGMGTFGSDKYTPEQVAASVVDGAVVGYRHFDCASVYGNETIIGEALKSVIASGIPREDLWITSKLWNDMHAAEHVRESCLRSMAELQLDYLDLYLVHWPFPNYHAPGCDVNARNPSSTSYIHERYMETWSAMEHLVKDGLVRNIGTSNMTIPKLDLLLRDCDIRPSVNEMELHPHFQQSELFDYVVKNNIVPIGYSPIGSPSRPLRDRTSDDTVDLTDPVILEIAEAHNISPASVCIKWAVQHGQVPIPFSVKRTQYKATFEAILASPLSCEEMGRIKAIDKNCRLIKGQVFLWKENQSWEDLWDINGIITPA